MKNRSGYISLIILLFLVIIGYHFRLKGIQNNHSFWSDEAFVSSISRNILLGKLSIVDGFQILSYQFLQVLITSTSFIFFGFTEFAARLPSILFGTIGIVFAYLLGTKLSNINGGLLSAFLFAFSQLNLANSTQAKPYTAIQTLLLVVLYLIFLLKENKKNHLLLHILIIISATASTLFNYIGILTWIPYIVYIFFLYRKNIITNIYKPYILIAAILIILGGIFLLQIPKMIIALFNNPIYNHTTYLRELLWRNYAFITLPAFIGLFTIFKKYRIMFIGISLYIFSLLFLWNFRGYSHNVRYLVPLFGLLFVLFGIFWGEIGDKVFNKKSGFICLIVAILIFMGGYKIVRKPASYYTPNADLYGDVQIADYKNTYEKIEKEFPDLNNIAVFNDVIDSQIWYMNKQSNAYFMKGVIKPTRHPVDNTIIYGSLKEFLNEKNKYPKGILIVEDWESFLPEDIKQYAKKNMKREFRIEGLPQAQGDNWPI
ncbi:MAG TPA: glycosyltransferase family 39 protein, partial [Candidatus Nitrosocosmicus sp.]|nr:glycosyltransferase family 39 protein [Candidatus Nitrosocosmicus sp.]